MLRANDAMTVQAFDSEENGRPVRKISVKHAEVLGGGFRDFTGSKSDRGVISLCISVPADLVTAFTNEGIKVSYWSPDDEPDEDGIEQPGLVTLKVNYDYYKQPKIYVKVGEDGELAEYVKEDLPGLQSSIFSDANFILKVVHGEFRKRPYTSLYVDTAWFTIKQDNRSPIEQDMLNEFGGR